MRGEPGVKDEPQHQKQGQVTKSQLESLDIDYLILDSNSNLEETVNSCIEKATKQNSPVAILVKKIPFKYNLKNS